MTLHDLLAQLDARSVRLWVEDGQLRFSAPKGVVQGALRDALVAHKPALIAHLTAAAARPRRAPAAPVQEMLWSLCRLESDCPALYVEPRAARLTGPLRVDVLQRAVDELVRRHESLRTGLAWGESGLEQVIAPPTSLPIEQQDLTGADRDAVDAVVNELAWRPFDLESGPLTRLGLLRLGAEEWILVLSQHHVVTDRWTASLLVRDLSALYAAFAAGQPSPLPPLPTTYARHAADQRAALETPRHRQLLDHWTATLDGVPEVLALPTDRPYPPRPSNRGARLIRAVEADLAAALDGFCRRAGATPFMVLTAAFAALLHRYGGQECVVLGTPIAGRLSSDLEAVAGYFVNTLALRTDPRPDQSFADLVAQVRERALTAFDHQDLPFGHLVRALPIDRRQPHPPVFQAMIAVQNMEMADLTLGDLALADYPLRVEVAKYPLLLTVLPEPDGAALVWDYQTDLFDGATVARVAEHFATLLADALDRPETALAALDLMPAAEAAELLAAAAPAPVPYPRDATVPRLFADQAARVPERTAVTAGPSSLTYGQLAEAADALAARLAAAGIRPGDRVGVALPRTPDLIVTLLAVLRTGAAYVPLDPEYPAERLSFMAADAGIRLLVAAEPVAWSDAPRLAPEGEPDGGAPLPPPPMPEDALAPAYVMYTSGSTGQPKGVSVPHRGIVRLVKGADYAPLDEAQVFLQLAPVSFDASTLEIWGALLNGARLVLAPPTREALDQLGRLVRESGVSLLWLTSGLFSLMVETDITALRGVKTLLAGGDALSPRHVAAAIAALPETTLVNGYGPTENTTFTCCHTFTGGVPERIAVGRPIANTTVHILDAQGRPVPVGVPGELWTGGDGLALGYHGRPDLTAERFVERRLRYGSADRVERLYATGDLARWVRDADSGLLVAEVLGRLDDQVKIRGFRIEPGEIEARLAALPGVADAAVVVQRPEGSAARLIGYYVADPVAAPACDPGTLRGRLGALLPDYMVPERLVRVEALPVTPNGKVDRRALAVRPVDAGGPALPDGSDAPATPTERLVAEVWQQVLGLDGPRRGDDFFLRGGHSLLAVRMVGALRDALEAAGRSAPISVRTAFEKPVLADLAAAIDAAAGTGALDSDAGPAPRGLGDRDLPLSFAQERLWTLEKMLSLGAAYTVPGAFRLRGALDVARMEAALAAVLARHRGVSVVFGEKDGAGVQHLMPPSALPLPPVAVPEAEVPGVLAAFAAEPFDLEAGPLARAALLRLGSEDHVLALALHHLVCDGWSIGVLLRDLAAAYGGAALPPLALQYTDYADWHRAWLSGDRLEALKVYWRRQLAEVPVLDLPTDHSRPPVPSNRGGAVSFTVPTAAVDRLCRDHGVTRFMLCAAAFAALLHRHSGQEDFAIGTPVSGRHHRGLADLVGFFADNLVVRTPVAGTDTFAALLARVKQTTLAAFEHQDLPFTLLVDALNPERRLDVTPLFQVMVAVDDGLDLDLALPGLAVTPVAVALPHAKYDLSLNLGGAAREDGHLGGSIEYNADLFRPATAERLARHFAALLEAAAADAGQTIASLDLRGAGQPAVPPVLSGRTVPHPVAGGLHRLIAAQARRTPDAPALLNADNSVALTHGDLDRRAARLAGRLRDAGLEPGGLVGVHLRRGLDLPVALLAVLKAGGAYVPLNPDHPAGRLAAIAAQARPAVILSAGPLPEGVSAPAVVAPLDADAGGDVPADVEVDGEAPAYVMFTSGSTGTPKGVVIPHRAVCNHLGWFTTTFGLGVDDVMVQMTSFDFDASVIELFAPFLAGGRLVVPASGASDALALADILRAAGVTVVQAVPSLYQVMLGEGLLADQPSLRAVLSGGETLSPDLMARLMAAAPKARVFNLYGPTETCIDALAWECRADFDGATVPVGRPVDNLRACILDADGRPLPEGLPGELAIAGTGVALGYLGAPDLTSAAFRADPFGPGLLYRTGDRARIGPEGVEYLGRLDQQLKVRGVRVEAGDIESALAALPGVRDCAVATVGGELAAALVGDPLDEAVLRAALAARLPRALVPARAVWLEALPRLSSGKIDRRALAALVRETTAAAGPEGTGPLSQTEQAVSDIWAEVLGHRTFGRDDDFFTCGGHSLRAVQVAARMRARWPVEVTVRDVFERPTVAALAALVEEAAGSAEARPPLVPQPRRRAADGLAIVPVSHAQRSLWFLDRLEGGSTAYTTVSAFLLDGRLDVEAARRALDAIAARHETLRTRFRLEGDAPVQVIDPPRPLPFAVDAAAQPDDPEALTALALAEASRPFDLSAEPPARFRLVPLSSGRHLGVLAWHHIATDGWSLGVFVREFRALYTAFATGGDDAAAALAPLPVQYGDYAVWQSAWLAGDGFRRHLDYWKEALAGAPQTLTLFGDRPRPPRQSFRGATHRFTIDPALTAALRRAAQEAGASLFMIGLAGFLTLVHRWSRQDDILVGTPVANRPTTEAEALIGFFANTLVLRGRMGDNPTFRAFLQQVRDTALAAFGHQDVPFERLVDALDPPRSLAHPPLFQVMFNLQNTPAEVLDLPGLRLTQVEVDTGTAKFDLLVTLVEDEAGGLQGHWEYSSDLFNPGTAAAMAAQYVQLLRVAVADTDRPLRSLPLLAAEDRPSLLAACHGPQRPGGGEGVLHHLFEEQAARTPEAVAAVFEDESLCYRDLDAWGDAVARRLVAAGVTSGAPVGIRMERSLELLAAVLGVLKAGGAYVPLDAALPEARLTFITEDAGLACVVTAQDDAAPPLPAGIRAIPVPPRPIAGADAGTPPQRAAVNGPHGPEDPVYLLYTSGSTGQPKGVRMPHRALVNLIRWQIAEPTFAPGLRTLQFTTLGFDVACQEIFATWATGGTLVMMRETLRRDMPALIAHAADQDVQRIFLPFTALQQIAEAWPLAERRPQGLRELLTAGERLRVSPALRAMAAALPGCRLTNQYGPTETHVATALVLPEDPAAWPEFPGIGTPVANTAVYVLDDDGEPLPPGVPGQLWIAGTAVSHGYLNRPDLTARLFRPDPFGTGGMMYATGDLACLRGDGRGGLTVDFLGRIDQQVKIRGFRVEPEEVEHALSGLDDVAEAAVVAWADATGEKRLVAYYVPVGGAAAEPRALREALGRLLPEYMVPTLWVPLAAMPQTASGKIDRRGLPAPSAAATPPQPRPAGGLDAPRSATERTLAAIWSQVLQCGDVGLHDNFFDLGGYSFLLLRVLAELRRAFPQAGHVTMVNLFEHPTVAGLARLVDGDGSGDGAGTVNAAVRHRGEDRRARLADRPDRRSLRRGTGAPTREDPEETLP